MSLRDVVAREKQTEGPGPASYVLVGGEAWNWHGVEPIKRQLSHTSVSFVCRAYNQLRELGVPPSSIITIVQLRDYLDGLNIAAQTEGVDSRLKIGYGFAHQSTLSAASRMLAEGGPTYDGKDVNPYTFWSVMNGEASEKVPIVVDLDSRFIFFAIYSHGYYHSAFPPVPLKVEVDLRVGEGAKSVEVGIKIVKEKGKNGKENGKENGGNGKENGKENIPGEEQEDILVGSYEGPSTYHIDPVTNEHVDPLTNEWYAFFPYAPDPPVPRLLDFVCVAGASSKHDRPETLLYSTQLKALLFELFRKRPKRPILGLLNYCKSGGNLEFMRRTAAVDHYGANKWPLWLMASSGACHNSLVGGLWQSFFDNLSPLQKSQERCSFAEYYRRVVFKYHKDNSYELLNLIKSQSYPMFEVEESPDDTYHQDLSGLLCAGEFGEPDFRALTKLQLRYHSGEKFGRPIYICFPKSDRRVDLAAVVRGCTAKIAAPEEVHGAMMKELDFSMFFPTPQEISSTMLIPPPPTPPRVLSATSRSLLPK